MACARPIPHQSPNINPTIAFLSPWRDSGETARPNGESKVLARNLAKYKVQKLWGVRCVFGFAGEISRQTGPVLVRWSTKWFGRRGGACGQPPCTCGRQYARYGILGHMSGCLMHTGHIPFVCQHTSSHHMYVDMLIERWLSLSQPLVEDALTSVAD